MISFESVKKMALDKAIEHMHKNNAEGAKGFAEVAAVCQEAIVAPGKNIQIHNHFNQEEQQ